ncbi:unnamed protein product [Rotaria magnacalcarata]|uniref:Uncharacterized protein n=2 Tax=Rotaria magnacalcarata TaxID=392030 RepID=A0A819S495_9BILA|nr:unnamed protein product [Rotaria magnacalcarata]
MIWHICFISLAPHLFEIQIFSSNSDHPMGHQHEYLSWTDNTHNQLVIESNTSSMHIDKCDRKLEYLIAICSITNKDYKQLYGCHPEQRQFHLQTRLKRSVSDKSTRSAYLVLSLGVGLPCLLVGIIIGTVITIVFSIRRQKRLEQRSQENNQIHHEIRSVNLNDDISTRLTQSKGIKLSPTFNAMFDHIPVLRERGIIVKMSFSKESLILVSLEISDNQMMVLNRYQPLHDQSVKQDRTPIQRPHLSNFVYNLSTIPHDNMPNNLITTKITSKQPYKVSKNVNSNMKHNFIRNTRPKSR